MYGYGIDNFPQNAYGNFNNSILQYKGNSVLAGLPQQQVIMVSGYNGANALQLGPNSSMLALDESGLMVWLVKTDGAGYKSVVQAYDITPHQVASLAGETSQYEERIARLEQQAERLIKLEQEIGEMKNASTNITSTSAGDKVTILRSN